MPKLTDTQAILLSTASQRENGSLLPAPETLTGEPSRISASTAVLIKRGLAELVEDVAPDRAYRSDGDRHLGAVITDAGRVAIGVEVEVSDGEGPSLAPDRPRAADAAEASSPPSVPRQTKAALVLALLCREQGATLAELVEATGWQSHTTRAALTGLRKRGHLVDKRKRDDITCYHVAAAA